MEHIDKQDCAVKEKPNELLSSFISGKKNEHSQYDMLDNINDILPTNIDEQLHIKCMSDDDYYALVRSS